MFLTESVSITIHVMKHPPQSKNHTKIIAFSHGLAPYLLWDEIYIPLKKHIEKSAVLLKKLKRFTKIFQHHPVHVYSIPYSRICNGISHRSTSLPCAHNL